jgi:leucyl/phenylalanyl-tRNA--protein transferase
MSLIDFPDPRAHRFADWVRFNNYYYNARDIVLFGGKLSAENLRRAYARGIFPWTIEGLPLPWFCPEKRAILEFSELHVPRSLRKEQKKQLFRFTIDAAFADVIKICAKIKRGDGEGTWITEEFIAAYTDLHEQGAAHSVEAWDKETNELVGGLYGVDGGGVFAGESMFHFAPNASKLALLHLIEHLESRGANWFDVQVLTPHIEALGAREISRQTFLFKLEQTLAQNLQLF